MSKQLQRNLVLTNLVACSFACVWAYATYIYNLLNVGGGSSPHQEQWFALRDVASIFTLIMWLVAIVLSAFAWQKRTLSAGLLATAISLSATPAVLVVAIWFLHRNFPWPNI